MGLREPLASAYSQTLIPRHLLFVKDDYGGGGEVPSAGSSFHLIFVTNRKGHSPRRPPPAAHPLGFLWVTASTTSQLC